jgi:molybdopterin molybdotransferase
VKAAAQDVGFTQQFWKVRQKPGKPLFFATRGGDDTLLFGLPGNPFSTLINALVYVYPVLRRLSGCPRPGLSEITGRLARPYDGLKPGRAKFLLVRLTERRTEDASLLEVVERQRSHMLSGLSAADGFILAEADRERIAPDERFSVHCFPWTDGRA